MKRLYLYIFLSSIPVLSMQPEPKTGTFALGEFNKEFPHFFSEVSDQQTAQKNVKSLSNSYTLLTKYILPYLDGHDAAFWQSPSAGNITQLLSTIKDSIYGFYNRFGIIDLDQQKYRQQKDLLNFMHYQTPLPDILNALQDLKKIKSKDGKTFLTNPAPPNIGGEEILEQINSIYSNIIQSIASLTIMTDPALNTDNSINTTKLWEDLTKKYKNIIAFTVSTLATLQNSLKYLYKQDKNFLNNYLYIYKRFMNTSTTPSDMPLYSAIAHISGWTDNPTPAQEETKLLAAVSDLIMPLYLKTKNFRFAIQDFAKTAMIRNNPLDILSVLLNRTTIKIPADFLATKYPSFRTRLAITRTLNNKEFDAPIKGEVIDDLLTKINQNSFFWLNDEQKKLYSTWLIQAKEIIAQIKKFIKLDEDAPDISEYVDFAIRNLEQTFDKIVEEEKTAPDDKKDLLDLQKHNTGIILKFIKGEQLTEQDILWSLTPREFLSKLAALDSNLYSLNVRIS